MLERLAHREERIEHELLRHHAQRAPRARGSRRRRRGPGCARVPAVGARRARRGSRSASSCRRRSGPSRPKNSPSLDREVDAGERLHAAEAAGDIDDFDGGGHGRAGTDGGAAGATARGAPRGEASAGEQLLDAVERGERAQRRRQRRRTRACALRRRRAAASASSTATAAESTCATPPQSTTRRRAAAASARAAVEHRPGVGERRARPRERQRAPPSVATNAAAPPRRAGSAARDHLAGDSLVLRRPAS